MNKLMRRLHRVHHSQQAANFAHYYGCGSWKLDAFADAAGWDAVATCSVTARSTTHFEEMTNLAVVAHDMRQRFRQATRIVTLYDPWDEIELIVLAVDAGNAAAVAAAADWGARVDHYGVADATQTEAIKTTLTLAGMDPDDEYEEAMEDFLIDCVFDERTDIEAFLRNYRFDDEDDDED